MKIKLEDLDIEMTLGNKGVLFSVYDNDNSYRGKLRIGKGTIEWCKGRTGIGNELG